MKELLFTITKKDLDITYYKASGKGGQNRNKRETAVRIQHKDSGVIVTASEQRNQHQNLKMAFKRLVNDDRFKKWLKIESARWNMKKQVVEREIENQVDEMMQDKYLKVEYI
jgi:protein subunit release factor B